MEFHFGDRVEIGGRTMLGPGFSLVGLAGMVIFPTAPGAPAGCLSVAVDWKGFNYTPETGYAEGSLPPVVNVPAEHLFLLEPNPTEYGVKLPQLKPDPNTMPKPQLGIVHGDKDPDETPPPPGEDEDEPPRPMLRLV